MIATFYWTSNGRVHGLMEGPQSLLDVQDPALSYIEGDYLVGYRIDLETLQPVLLLDFDPVVGINTISGLPEGAIVQVGEDQPHTIYGGTATFEVESPDTITVRLEHLHYNPTEVEVPCEPD